jgi:hypothetical protein
MSVRATGSLIADVVVATGLKGPKMVVQAIDEEKKQVTTVWFSDDGKAQSAVFPAQALDRDEISVKPAAAKKDGEGKRGKPGKK